jgi:hypothetical protein
LKRDDDWRSALQLRDQSSGHRPFNDARRCAADLSIEAKQLPLRLVRFDGKLAPKRLANQAELTDPTRVVQKFQRPSHAALR